MPGPVMRFGSFALLRFVCRRLASLVVVRTTFTRTERSEDRLDATLPMAVRTSIARSSTEAASRPTLVIFAETSWAAAADAATDRQISEVAACCCYIAAATGEAA